MLMVYRSVILVFLLWLVQSVTDANPYLAVAFFLFGMAASVYRGIQERIK